MAGNSKMYDMRLNHQKRPIGQKFEILVLRLG